MNKEMNKLLRQMIKYDFGSGLVISLVIKIIYPFSNAEIYFIGMCVSLINFLVNGYVIGKFLGKDKKQWIIIASYFLRMGFIVLTVLPFTNNINKAIYYSIGFVSHYIIFIVFSIKNRKGSV